MPSRAPCLNRVQGAAHRVGLAHFDNREHPAGMDLCVYCDVGYEFRFSPPNWGVVDPRGGVAKWVAVKGFPAPANRLSVGRVISHTGPRLGVCRGAASDIEAPFCKTPRNSGSQIPAANTFLAIQKLDSRVTESDKWCYPK